MELVVKEKKEGSKRIGGSVSTFCFDDSADPYLFEHGVLSDFCGLDVCLKFKVLPYYLVGKVREVKERGDVADMFVYLLSGPSTHFLVEKAIVDVFGSLESFSQKSQEVLKLFFISLMEDFYGLDVRRSADRRLVGKMIEFFEGIKVPEGWLKNPYEREKFRSFSTPSASYIDERVNKRFYVSAESLYLARKSFPKLGALVESERWKLDEKDFKLGKELVELYSEGRLLDVFSHFLFGRDFKDVVGSEGKVRYVLLEGAMPVEVVALKAVVGEIRSVIREAVENKGEGGSGKYGIVNMANALNILTSAMLRDAQKRLEGVLDRVLNPLLYVGKYVTYDAVAMFQLGNVTGVVVPRELPDIYGKFESAVKTPAFSLFFAVDKFTVFYFYNGAERVYRLFFEGVFDRLDSGASLVVKDVRVVKKENGEVKLRVRVEKNGNVVGVELYPDLFFSVERPKVSNVLDFVLWTP